MNYSSQIDKYLDGILQGKELEEFEKKLETDPEFAEAVKMIRSLYETVSRFIKEVNKDQAMQSKVKNPDNPDTLKKNALIERDIEKATSDTTPLTREQEEVMQSFRELMIKKESEGKKSKFIRIHRFWVFAACFSIFFLVALTALAILCKF